MYPDVVWRRDVNKNNQVHDPAAKNTVLMFLFLPPSIKLIPSPASMLREDMQRRTRAKFVLPCDRADVTSGTGEHYTESRVAVGGGGRRLSCGGFCGGVVVGRVSLVVVEVPGVLVGSSSSISII